MSKEKIKIEIDKSLYEGLEKLIRKNSKINCTEKLLTSEIEHSIKYFLKNNEIPSNISNDTINWKYKYLKKDLKPLLKKMKKSRKKELKKIKELI